MLKPYYKLLVSLRYLTSEEAFELQEFGDGFQPIYYKWETTRERILKNERFDELIAKIDHEVVYDIVDRELTKKKLDAAKKKKHASYELGAREFTLTYSPKWFSDQEARVQMERAIYRLIKYYKNGDQRILKLRAIGEVGINGLSHVHCFYQLLGGVKITDKNFKRAWPPWDTKIKQGPTGHKGGHHASVRHHADFLGYIEKQVSEAWLDITHGDDDPTN